ncbi:uncharacterized protein [Triticum aestivum]|uniref:uncharacterized protein n=1 Tax=Triticum aestivum TaxID=4565 RepID=UPI001D0045A3|nr:uncharacterized protein LOC123056778 [Triticum aestivum]
MRKKKTPPISNFFKPIASNSTVENANATVEVDVTEQPTDNSVPNLNSVDMPPPKQNIEASVEVEVLEQQRIGSTPFERDPGKRKQIWELPLDKQNEARQFYISEGRYMPYMREYPYNDDPPKHRRRFQYSWFKDFEWLEFSPYTKRAYCFHCFLFSRKPIGKCGSETFTVLGFDRWKKVNNGKECAFLTHMGKDAGSAHNFSARCYDNFKNSMTHIDKVYGKATAKTILDARLRLKVTIDSIRWLTFQACAFRGHDESPGSINRGNFLELVKLLASYNKEVKDVVLENAPENAKYTSHQVQEEILAILSRKVQRTIREEIGDSKFCIMVDEARDESKKEQMALVLRFPDTEGFIQERFVDVIHVNDTLALTLKETICTVLADNNLNVEDIRGQAYDGANNMRGEWNRLKALILKACPYAYYIHCMAHQLQLALVAASREILSNTKVLLADLREEGWEPLIEEVKTFCVKHEVEIPDMSRKYVDVTKSRNKHNNITVLHHYKADVFNVAIDQQLVELNDRFSVQTTELMTLCASLDPRHDSFDISKICMLVDKFYPADFSSQEQARLESQLPHYQLDVCNHPELNSSSSLADLTVALHKTGKASVYPMVDRLLRLVITLPVSTATAERAFSALSRHVSEVKWVTILFDLTWLYTLGRK